MVNQHQLAMARGDIPADLVLKGGMVYSVFTGELLRAAIAITADRSIGIGDYDVLEKYDVTGRILLPGFIDGHCHLESSRLTPVEFARTIVPCGTTTAMIDPHELANVLGMDGIRYILDASRDLPL